MQLTLRRLLDIVLTRLSEPEVESFIYLTDLTDLIICLALRTASADQVVPDWPSLMRSPFAVRSWRMLCC